MKKVVLFLLLSLIFVSGCSDNDVVEKVSFKSISSEEAYSMMNESEDLIIVDVRSSEEYSTGHIESAINIPVNEIGNRFKDEVTSDTQTTILVYCKSGVRAKQASELLADLGYSNVYEFGGILDWKHDLVSD